MSWNLTNASRRGAAILMVVFALGCTGGDGDGDLVVGADAGTEAVADAAPICSEEHPELCEECPANSTRIENSDPPACACNEGYAFDESGDLCVVVEQNNCPPHSSPFEENGQSGCRCDEGYVANQAGNACVLPANACPENSSYYQENGQSGCRCDEGYVVNSAGNGCELAQECPAGNPKATVNGVVVLCCPADAEGVQLSGGVWSCTCADGESYDAALNQCL